MTRIQALTRLHEILDGMDRDEVETDRGWWETSSGAAFGAKKLVELEELVMDLTQ